MTCTQLSKSSTTRYTSRLLLLFILPQGLIKFPRLAFNSLCNPGKLQHGILLPRPQEQLKFKVLTPSQSCGLACRHAVSNQNGVNVSSLSEVLQWVE